MRRCRIGAVYAANRAGNGPLRALPATEYTPIILHNAYLFLIFTADLRSFPDPRLRTASPIARDLGVHRLSDTLPISFR